MNKVITLRNPGLIPMEAVTTMGVSAKEGETPIGFFGTGIKYAIAGLLRTGHKVIIFRGLEQYTFTSRVQEVRGKEFDFIYMVGPAGEEKLGFTTHLGSHWEMWQIFRELYSNMLDESGEMTFGIVPPAEDHTTIYVSGTGFADAARAKDRFFLSSKPLHKGVLADIHEGATNGLYYRGVLVAMLQEPARFSYNITTSMTLTEDRTLKDRYTADSYIAHMISNLSDPFLAEEILSRRQGTYEGGLQISSPSGVVAEKVLEMCERSGPVAVNASAVVSTERWAQKEARVKEMVLSPREAEELEAAKAFLARIGYEITSEIIVAESLGPGVAGMAKRGKVYLSRIAISRGGNYLIGTLLEEHLHLVHGFADESRGFQDFLIDLVVKFAKDADYQGPAPIPITPKPAALEVDAADEVPF